MPQLQRRFDVLCSHTLSTRAEFADVSRAAIGSIGEHGNTMTYMGAPASTPRTTVAR